MILALRILTDRKSRHLAPVSRSLTTSFAETRALSQREGRKPQAQASLATRSTDATRFDNPTAGSSFFLALAVTAPALDTRTPSRPRSRPHALRRLATCTCRHRCLRLSSLGDETTVPRFPTSALVFRRLRCGEPVLILPFRRRFSRARQAAHRLAESTESKFPTTFSHGTARRNKALLDRFPAIEICTSGQPMVQQPKPVLRRSSKGLTNPQRPNDGSKLAKR